MIREYLEKIQKELIDHKRELEKQIISLENTEKENIKFIELLDESNDPNYEAFTPRTVNVRNKEKINELKAQQKSILNEKSELKTKLYDVQRRLEECQSIIQCEREKENIVQQYQKDDDAEYMNKIQLLEAQEMERQRIARDLHDSTVQDLTSMLHKIELSLRVMDMDPQRCKMELSNVLDNIRNVISNTRKMIYNLRPMSVDDIGIDVTLKHAIAKIEHEWNRKIEYIIIGKPFHVKPVVALSLLRIMQEACTNALKYSEADEICVVLEYTENDISLVIEDNGIGFNPNKKIAKTKNSGFGLSIMKERVHLLSGEIHIESEEGKGTTITVHIPNNYMEERDDEKDEGQD